MSKSGIEVFLFVVAIVAFVALALVFMPKSDPEVRSIDGNNAFVPTGSRLILYGGNISHTIQQKDDTVEISAPLMSPTTAKLCGSGCTVSIPFHWFFELKVTQSRGGITVTWPWGFVQL